jgi:hypothetical protein
MDANLHIGEKEYTVDVKNRKSDGRCPEYSVITISIPTEGSREEDVIFYNNRDGLNEFCLRLGKAVIEAER